MNFEYLVQRYIDGEITPKEDLQLQQLMKESPYLRAQFDNIVHIQHAYSQSTKPLLNEKDSAAIFDTLKIAMVASIASTAHAPMTTSSFIAVASNVVLPILISLFFLISPNNATSPLLKYVAFQSPNSLIASIEKNSFQTIDKSRIENTIRIENSSFVSSKQHSNFNSELQLNIENSDEHQPVISTILPSMETNNWLNENEFVNNEKVSVLPIMETNDAFNSNASKLPFTPFISNNVPIKFEFTVSASFQNSNTLGSIRSNPIISQYLAINYGIDNHNRFGIEFGSTSFIGLAYGAITKPQNDENVYGSGIQNASNSNDESPENRGDNTKIKPNNPNKYYCEDIEFRKNIQIYQSSVFFERELFDTPFLAINSRVGVGVTNIGITSYTKAIVEVKPNDNLSIFGGAEYRVLTGNAGSALQQDTRASSMMSIQTGITIKF
ncbi:MAG: hypothetical protein JNL36_09565 [Candidatus Kapabacteria bacterium]|nr:hypothetical protein [Candidatus Kapabacteria bacterium]